MAGTNRQAREAGEDHEHRGKCCERGNGAVAGEDQLRRVREDARRSISRTGLGERLSEGA